MAITDRTRKILWTRAGNQCALCQCKLIMPSETENDPAAVVGDECHIVGKTPDSARYRDDLTIDPDSYDNLIVLCKTHHKLIDGQPVHFTEEILITLKSNHEQRIQTILDRMRDAEVQRLNNHELLLRPSLHIEVVSLAFTDHELSNRQNPEFIILGQYPRRWSMTVEIANRGSIRTTIASFALKISDEKLDAVDERNEWILEPGDQKRLTLTFPEHRQNVTITGSVTYTLQVKDAFGDEKRLQGVTSR